MICSTTSVDSRCPLARGTKAVDTTGVMPAKGLVTINSEDDAGATSRLVEKQAQGHSRTWFFGAGTHV